MTEMEERVDAAVVEWARRIPVDQIPSVVAFLFARLVSEGSTSRKSEGNGASAREAEKFLTANELAKRLGVPESWVRTEERAGRIPSVRLGKYVRFKLSAVERVLAERQCQGGVTVRLPDEWM
jgi:excisionase family DNA binding protein